MKRYTKEYVEKLLNKFMDGTSTLEEEEILAQYFRQGNVPSEWEDYRLLFQEIDEMKPVSPEIVAKKRWIGWSVAAAVVAGILYLSIPSRQIEPSEILTAQVDTTTTILPKNQVIEQKMDTVSPQKPPVQSPKRSRRKPRPTMTDYDKAYALMAKANQEMKDVERQMAQCQLEIVEAQLAAYGYIPVMQEDGTIIYINEQTNLIAYEE
ncbi:MAG: hypothetical protein IK067_07505 [Prevotella sp.]|nr:hypothetical protein [Prevotella sp.]